jgi:FG-GAP-like repeat/Bacterial Ig-like domain
MAACGGGGGGGGGGSGKPGVEPSGPLGPPDTADYFPLPSNGRWLDTDGWLSRVTGPDATAGAGAIRVSSTLRSDLRESTYRTTASSVVLVGSRSTDALTRALGDVVLLRLPVRTGDTWLMYDTVVEGVADVDRDGRPDRLALRAVASVVGYEAIETAAGRFERALRVRIEDQQAARLAATGAEASSTVITDNWYVANIGRVRSVSTQQSPQMQLARSELQGYRVAGLRTDVEAPAVRGRPVPSQPSTDTRIEIYFSEEIDPLSASVPIRAIGSNGLALPGTASWQGNSVLRLSLDQPVPTDTYRISLSPELTDRLGNAIEGDREWVVDYDFTAPRVTSVSPATGATEVPIDATIDVVLDEPIAHLTLQVSLSGEPLYGTVTGEGRQWRFTPKSPLFKATHYEIFISGNDFAGNVIGTVRHSFFTEVGRFDALAAPERARANRHIAPADVDRDGRIDVVVLTHDGEFVLLRQLVDGSFEPRLIGAAGSLETRFSLVDLDADGRIDLLPSHSGVWWHQRLDGGFDRRALPDNGFTLSDVQVLRGSGGRLDLLGLWAGQPRILRQVSAGTFSPAQNLALGASSIGTPTVGDVNGDGLDDVVSFTSFGTSSLLAIDYQQPDGSFGARQTLPVSSLLGRNTPIRISDVDRDGRPDLLFSAAGGPLPAVHVMRQVAASVFVTTVGSADAGRWLEVVDMDADGRLDIVSADNSTLVLYLQRADGSLAAGELYRDARFSSPTEAPPAIAVADFDGDGRLEVMAGGVLWRPRPSSGPSSTARTNRKADALGLHWLRTTP